MSILTKVRDGEGAIAITRGARTRRAGSALPIRVNLCVLLDKFLGFPF